MISPNFGDAFLILDFFYKIETCYWIREKRKPFSKGTVKSYLYRLIQNSYRFFLFFNFTFIRYLFFSFYISTKIVAEIYICCHRSNFRLRWKAIIINTDFLGKQALPTLIKFYNNVLLHASAPMYDWAIQSS